MTTAELQALYDKTWALRAEIVETWPTPPPLDAAEFSCTEACEALDADLRTRGGYARNHAKEPDLFGELADWAMMLITTLGPDCVIDHWSEHVPSILADMNYETAFVYWYLTSGKLDVSRIVGILHAIAAYPGMDLPAELDKRLAKIKAKHGPQTELLAVPLTDVVDTVARFRPFHRCGLNTLADIQAAIEKYRPGQTPGWGLRLGPAPGLRAGA